MGGIEQRYRTANDGRTLSVLIANIRDSRNDVQAAGIQDIRRTKRRFTVRFERNKCV